MKKNNRIASDHTIENMKALALERELASSAEQAPASCLRGISQRKRGYPYYSFMGAGKDNFSVRK